MLKVGNNKYIVYNCDGLIVLFTVNKQEGKTSKNVYFKTYANNKNLSNDYIENNLDKSLSVKDKVVAAYKRSILNRRLSEEIVLAGEILKPVYLGQEVLKTREDEITRMIRDCLIEGSFVSGFETSNGINVNVSIDELNEIIKQFKNLEKEHQKRSSINKR